MQRRAFQLRVREGQTEAYDEAHRHVWPELLNELRSFGVRDYSIFRRGQDLFLYLRVPDWKQLLGRLATSSINLRWQAEMAPLFEPVPSLRLGETVAVMDEVFFTSGETRAAGEYPMMSVAPTGTRKVRVGLVGFGLEAYWSQFEGLQARLLGHLQVAELLVSGDRREIVNLGLVDTPQRAILAAHRSRREEIDILLVYGTTYALSSTVLPVIKRSKVPVILLNVQPSAALDYARLNAMEGRTEMTGEWLAYCSPCPVPEIANVLRRLEIPFHQVTGTLDPDDVCWLELNEWLRAAEVVHALAHSRLGLMGHYYGGMLDIATDLTQVSGRFDLHIEMLEVDELCALRRLVTEGDIEAKVEEFRGFFDVGESCSKAELQRAARTAIALDSLVAQKDLDLLAYFYNGIGIPENVETITSMILGSSMLTGRGKPVAGEYEVKNVIAMKILDLLGAGGSFTEYYAMDFAADVVLMGHDGPGHVGIAEGKIHVRPLTVYHGKVGAGLSVEMSVKHGPITLLSIVEEKAHGFMLLIAEGESVPGPILEIGNTNSRYRFPLGARGFVESWNAHGPAHHCAIGVGHIAGSLEKIAALLQLRSVRVC